MTEIYNFSVSRCVRCFLSLACYHLNLFEFDHLFEQMWTNVHRAVTVCLTANTATTFRVLTNVIAVLTTSSTAAAAYTVGTAVAAIDVLPERYQKPF